MVERQREAGITQPGDGEFRHRVHEVELVAEGTRLHWHIQLPHATRSHRAGPEPTRGRGKMDRERLQVLQQLRGGAIDAVVDPGWRPPHGMHVAGQHQQAAARKCFMGAAQHESHVTVPGGGIGVIIWTDIERHHRHVVSCDAQLPDRFHQIQRVLGAATVVALRRRVPEGAGTHARPGGHTAVRAQIGRKRAVFSAPYLQRHQYRALAGVVPGQGRRHGGGFSGAVHLADHHDPVIACFRDNPRGRVGHRALSGQHTCSREQAASQNQADRQQQAPPAAHYVSTPCHAVSCAHPCAHPSAPP